MRRRWMSGTSPERARKLDVVKRAPPLGEHNMNKNEQMIREQAYELWDHAGRPDGRNDEFWFAARGEFEREEETGEDLRAHVPPHVSPSYQEH
jgi:hypothetical protein